MKRAAHLLLVGLLAAACGDSIESNGQAPAGSAGAEGAAGSAGSEPVDSNGSQAEEPVAAGPVETGPIATEPVVTEPAVTEPVATEPGAVGPDATDPDPIDSVAPDAAEPTSSVVRFYGGSGDAEFPWVPLGAWDGTGWLSFDFDASGDVIPLPPPEIASVAVTSVDLPDGPESVITGLTLGPEQTFCVGDETGPVIVLPAAIPDSAASLGYDAVAVTADWDLQPRPVRQVGVEAPVYGEVGAALFDGQTSTAAQGTVLQAIRADLDGDGIEEVIVTYERQESPDFGGEGDFTGIYVRYPSPDGTVADELISSYVSADPADFPTPGRFTVVAVADLNGDGTMEVMVRSRFWESGGISVYSLIDDRLVAVAGGGCSV